jgi:hypothetical protein
MESKGNTVRFGDSSRCCDARPSQGLKASDSTPLSASGGWEGVRSLDKSEDLPVITQRVQPAVNGKLIITFP